MDLQLKRSSKLYNKIFCYYHVSFQGPLLRRQICNIDRYLYFLYLTQVHLLRRIKQNQRTTRRCTIGHQSQRL